MKELKLTCRDIGVDCDIVFTGDTPEDIMRKASEHAISEHNLPAIPKNIYEKCIAAMQEVEK